MNRKTFNLVTAIIGGIQTIGVGVVTFMSPEYATAINASIVAVGAVVIECCSYFVKE